MDAKTCSFDKSLTKGAQRGRGYEGLKTHPLLKTIIRTSYTKRGSKRNLSFVEVCLQNLELFVERCADRFKKKTEIPTSLESILASSLALRMRLTIHLSASSGVMFSLSASMLVRKQRGREL